MKNNIKLIVFLVKNNVKLNLYINNLTYDHSNLEQLTVVYRERPQYLVAKLNNRLINKRDNKMLAKLMLNTGWLSLLSGYALLSCIWRVLEAS